ncbi:TPA: hypothetical protein ACQ39K_004964, partial [Yersinia enterocolitica]
SERQASATTQEENIQAASVAEHLPKAERNLSEIISRPPIPFGDNEKSLNVKNDLVEPTVALSEIGDDPILIGDELLGMNDEDAELIAPPTPENSEFNAPSIIPIHNYKIFCNKGEETYTLVQDAIMAKLWKE